MAAPAEGGREPGWGGSCVRAEEPRRQTERSALRGRRTLGRCSGRDGRHGTCPLLWRTTSQKRSQTPTRQLQMQGLQHGCPASWFGVWCPFLSRPVPPPAACVLSVRTGEWVSVAVSVRASGSHLSAEAVWSCGAQDALHLCLILLQNYRALSKIKHVCYCPFRSSLCSLLAA